MTGDWGAWLGVGVSEVRGGWGTAEYGPLVPGSAVRVAPHGTPVDVGAPGLALAVRGVDGRLIVCGIADVRPGETVVGRVVEVQPPGGAIVRRVTDD